MTLVAIDGSAENRLHQLGLAADLLARALLRADAVAKLATGLVNFQMSCKGPDNSR
jgi:hypothetical protein